MNCGGCKYFAQGKNNSFCAHPDQRDNDAKAYVYWSFGTNCALYQSGIHQSRVDFMSAKNVAETRRLEKKGFIKRIFR